MLKPHRRPLRVAKIIHRLLLPFIQVALQDIGYQF